MAMPSTARRSDPHSTRFPSDIEPPRSPRSVHPTSRPSTPRPSISPLSTASVAVKSSPIAPPKLAMPDAVSTRAADHREQLDTTDAADDVDPRDDRSSSLSEPEDEPDDDMLQNGIRQDMAAVEELAAQQSLEIDSEAETERLDQTPHRLRKHADSMGKIPGKLNQAATVDDELSDPPSPLPVGPGAASSTSTAATASTSSQSRHPAIHERSDLTKRLVGKKRKRSDTGDSSLSSAGSEFDQSPRKRSHELSPDDEDDEDDDDNADEDRATADNPDAEPTESTEAIPETLEAEATSETTIAPAKSGRGRKGRVKGKLKNEPAKDVDHIETIPQVEDEHSEDSAGKTPEELQHKHEASSRFEDLAKHFTAFREKLYSERLAAMTAELDMLNQPTCKHPEYLRQVACVDARYAKQVHEVQALYRYKIQTLRRSTLGERGQLHSQYFQYTRDLRENILSKLGEDWYNIQKERRQNSQANDEAYIPKFPTKKSVQIRQQAKYNQEVSVLSGVAKYVGFPAAPEITGAPSDQLDDDLKAMKITKRAPPATTAPVHVSPFLSFGNTKMVQTSSQIQQHERLAHEQFIEQNAWARPQGPIHTHGTPNLTHTADWAEPVTHNSAKHLIRNLSEGVHHPGSAYSTPITPRHGDPAEPPSSVQAAPPTAERLHQHHHHHHHQHHHHHHHSAGNTSPLTVTKSRQSHPPNTQESMPAVTDFRNFSGASTIDAPPDPSADSGQQQPRRPFGPGTVDEDDGGGGGGHSDYPRAALRRSAEPPLLPGFRPQDGAFGTPAPFGSSTTAATTATPSSAN